MSIPKIRELNPLVNKLKPVVMIGSKGLTDAIQAEIDMALEHHELIKIRITGGDRIYRQKIIDEICKYQHALLIKKIGHIFAIYRKKQN